MFESLTPKAIILNQLESRFKSLDLVSLMLTYNLETNTSDCKGKNSINQSFKIEVDKSENDMIKNMLIKKIKRKFKNDFKELIVNINMKNKTINLYVRNKELELNRLEL